MIRVNRVYLNPWYETQKITMESYMTTFANLWDNFPDKYEIQTVCTNKQKDSNDPFDNYCSILLSECFIQSGIDTNSMLGTNAGLTKKVRSIF